MEKVLLLRSGRHLVAAVRALRRARTGTHVVVLTRPGSEAALDEAGVAPTDRIAYTPRQFSPFGVLWVAVRCALTPGTFARVAVLWDNEEGAGFANVTWAGLCLSPSGVIAVLPDGAARTITLRDMIRNRLARPARLHVTAAIDRLTNRWWQWLRRLEGSELEPAIWHSHYLGLYAIARDLTPVMRTLRGLVLDIGSGTGHACRYLDPVATRYLGLDLPTGRDATDAGISREGQRPQVFGNAYALPLRDGTVDAVISMAVLEHVRDPQRVLREAFRVLKPGGQVAVYVPFLFPFHGEPHDYRRWTTHGVVFEAEAAGFAVERVEKVGGTPAGLLMTWELYVKYEVLGRAGRAGRLVLAAVWPFQLALQAVVNRIARVSRPSSHTTVPTSVVVVAHKPVA